MGKTKIVIDYGVCGDGNGLDPRTCSKCLKVCDPALFLMHQTLGMEDQEKVPFNPEFWRVTPLYPSLCTHCMKCVRACPENAITISWRPSLFSKFHVLS